jgi:Sensors of blue-light using FAD
MLVQCLYASRPAESLGPAQIESILDQSRRNNPRLGVTGILCFTSDVFIQVLEGGRDEVCELFNGIVRDDRHRDVRILVYEEISERKFGNWTMGQVDISRINPGVLLKYCKRASLDPFDMSGHATLALIHELVASAAIVGRTI